MRKLSSTLLFVASCAFLASTAQGLMIFTVDAVAKTFDVSGSVVGTPVSLGPTSFLRYSSPESGTVAGSNSINLTSETLSSPSPIFSTILVVRDYDVQDDAYIDFTYSGSGQFPEQTISINATGIDYTEMAVEYQAVLESLASAGTTMTVESGTSSDTIQITAVPEPSTYAALAGLAAFGLVALRRRLTVKQTT